MSDNNALTWKPVDVSTFTGSLKKAFEDYAVSARVTAQKRGKFEEALRAALAPMTPSGMAPVFSYRFGIGNLAVAFKTAGEVKMGKKAKPEMIRLGGSH